MTAICPGGTYCSYALGTDYDDNLKKDDCAGKQHADDEDKISDYFMWVPEYRKKPCTSPGFTQCSLDASQFSSRKVVQEAFLQGRGNVSISSQCGDVNTRYLPEALFDEGDQKPNTTYDLSLFPKHTKNKRSCHSVTDYDLLDEYTSFPGHYQDTYAPLAGTRGETYYGDSRQPESVNRLNRRYPSWEELNRKYMD